MEVPDLDIKEEVLDFIDRDLNITPISPIQIKEHEYYSVDQL